MSMPYTTRPLPPRRPRRPRTTGFPMAWRRRKHPGAANLRLVSAGTGVPAKLAAESPTLMVLAVEDLCWQLGVAELEGRRPHFWRRAEHAAWAEEQARWEAKRVRLAAMAHEAIAEL
jgi:hypothetical protein